LSVPSQFFLCNHRSFHQSHISEIPLEANPFALSKNPNMRFTYLLTALSLTSTAVYAQDLNSLLSEASDFVATNTELASVLSSVSELVDSATSALTDASAYSSVLSDIESGVNAATSAAGSLASGISTAATGLTGTAASATATATTNTGNGVDRVALPAAGAFGAAILGLAAML
jgi:hypothetical protein